MIVDPLWLITLSEVLTNLSAGWFGAAFVVPISSKRPRLKLWILLINIGSGTIAFVSAIVVKKLAGSL